jgi:hypothetical protein
MINLSALQRILAGILAVLLFSCNKSDDNNNDGNYFIRAKVNGELVEFKQTAIANKTTKTITGTAFRNMQNNFPFFSFDIESENSISAGTFRENNNSFIMIFRYGLGVDELFHSQMGEEEDFLFVVDRITNEVIEGSFQGTIRNAYNFSQSIAVTEGRFLLKVVP